MTAHTALCFSYIITFIRRPKEKGEKIIYLPQLIIIMPADKQIDEFLSQYDEQVFINAHKLRNILFANLPGITEQIDIKARMIGYCYGQKYAELICVIIPSRKGLKLGFNRGNELPDPKGLLEGKAKISRYIEIRSDEQIKSPALVELLVSALTLYRQRMTIKK